MLICGSAADFPAAAARHFRPGRSKLTLAAKFMYHCQWDKPRTT